MTIRYNVEKSNASEALRKNVHLSAHSEVVDEKYASAHHLRRSFGTHWAALVTPAT
jgi:hypothetical protein